MNDRNEQGKKQGKDCSREGKQHMLKDPGRKFKIRAVVSKFQTDQAAHQFFKKFLTLLQLHVFGYFYIVYTIVLIYYMYYKTYTKI